MSDGKKLRCIGRLTDKWINKLQNYYGLAIRQNTDNLFNMRKAVGAVLYHSSVASTSEARHRFCTNDSEWCKYRLAEKDGKPFDEKPGLPAVIRDKIMPMFRDLSSEDLLRKCLHGNTQNNNEGLNAFIWKRLPKDIFVGRHVLQMAVCSAVLHYNSGAERMMDVLKRLDLNVGNFTKQYCLVKNKNRIKNMKRKMSADGKAYRKHKRAQRKGFQGKEADKEGEMYGTGEF